MYRAWLYDNTYYEISKRARQIGESLLQDCPQNDCTIYRNLYDDYIHMVADYRQGAGLLGDATLSLIYREINRLGLEIERMRLANYAVGLLVRERIVAQSDGKAAEHLSYVVTSDDIKAAIKAVRALERQSSSSGSIDPISMPCSNKD